MVATPPEVSTHHKQERGDDPEFVTYFVGEGGRGAAVLNRELEARAQDGQGRPEDTTRVDDMTVDDPQDIARAPPLLDKGEYGPDAAAKRAVASW
mgnify:CR=1 FL=1